MILNNQVVFVDTILKMILKLLVARYKQLLDGRLTLGRSASKTRRELRKARHRQTFVAATVAQRKSLPPQTS